MVLSFFFRFGNDSDGGSEGEVLSVVVGSFEILQQLQTSFWSEHRGSQLRPP